MFTDQTPVNTEAIVNRFLLYENHTVEKRKRRKKHAVIFSFNN